MRKIFNQFANTILPQPYCCRVSTPLLSFHPFHRLFGHYFLSRFLSSFKLFVKLPHTFARHLCVFLGPAIFPQQPDLQFQSVYYFIFILAHCKFFD